MTKAKKALTRPRRVQPSRTAGAGQSTPPVPESSEADLNGILSKDVNFEDGTGDDPGDLSFSRLLLPIAYPTTYYSPEAGFSHCRHDSDTNLESEKPAKKTRAKKSEKAKVSSLSSKIPPPAPPPLLPAPSMSLLYPTAAAPSSQSRAIRCCWHCPLLVVVASVVVVSNIVGDVADCREVRISCKREQEGIEEERGRVVNVVSWQRDEIVTPLGNGFEWHGYRCEITGTQRSRPVLAILPFRRFAWGMTNNSGPKARSVDVLGTPGVDQLVWGRYLHYFSDASSV
ncbi:hypothetical protein R3P38DRAFT_2761572 [Favolaschia claudopus]|uniref:Uncharacterized protein n=1 Tax=Favolaschia claudopus TaxID=2862362 RepID=A0AAW0DPI5_9AGAR